jgi:hypothetical protein
MLEIITDIRDSDTIPILQFCSQVWHRTDILAPQFRDVVLNGKELRGLVEYLCDNTKISILDLLRDWLKKKTNSNANANANANENENNFGLKRLDPSIIVSSLNILVSKTNTLQEAHSKLQQIVLEGQDNTNVQTAIEQSTFDKNIENNVKTNIEQSPVNPSSNPNPTPTLQSISHRDLHKHRTSLTALSSQKNVIDAAYSLVDPDVSLPIAYGNLVSINNLLLLNSVEQINPDTLNIDSDLFSSPQFDKRGAVWEEYFHTYQKTAISLARAYNFRIPHIGFNYSGRTIPILDGIDLTGVKYKGLRAVLFASGPFGSVFPKHLFSPAIYVRSEPVGNRDIRPYTWHSRYDMLVLAKDQLEWDNIGWENGLVDGFADKIWGKGDDKLELGEFLKDGVMRKSDYQGESRGNQYKHVRDKRIFGNLAVSDDKVGKAGKLGKEAKEGKEGGGAGNGTTPRNAFDQFTSFLPFEPGQPLSRCNESSEEYDHIPIGQQYLNLIEDNKLVKGMINGRSNKKNKSNLLQNDANNIDEDLDEYSDQLNHSILDQDITFSSSNNGTPTTSSPSSSSPSSPSSPLFDSTLTPHVASPPHHKPQTVFRLQPNKKSPKLPFQFSPENSLSILTAQSASNLLSDQGNTLRDYGYKYCPSVAYLRSHYSRKGESKMSQRPNNPVVNYFDEYFHKAHLFSDLHFLFTFAIPSLIEEFTPIKDYLPNEFAISVTWGQIGSDGAKLVFIRDDFDEKINQIIEPRKSPLTTPTDSNRFPLTLPRTVNLKPDISITKNEIQHKFQQSFMEVLAANFDMGKNEETNEETTEDTNTNKTNPFKSAYRGKIIFEECKNIARPYPFISAESGQAIWANMALASQYLTFLQQNIEPKHNNADKQAAPRPISDFQSVVSSFHNINPNSHYPLLENPSLVFSQYLSKWSIQTDSPPLFYCWQNDDSELRNQLTPPPPLHSLSFPLYEHNVLNDRPHFGPNTWDTFASPSQLDSTPMNKEDGKAKGDGSDHRVVQGPGGANQDGKDGDNKKAGSETDNETRHTHNNPDYSKSSRYLINNGAEFFPQQWEHLLFSGPQHSHIFPILPPLPKKENVNFEELESLLRKNDPAISVKPGTNVLSSILKKKRPYILSQLPSDIQLYYQQLIDLGTRNYTKLAQNRKVQLETPQDNNQINDQNDNNNNNNNNNDKNNQQNDFQNTNFDLINPKQGSIPPPPPEPTTPKYIVASSRAYKNKHNNFNRQNNTTFNQNNQHLNHRLDNLAPQNPSQFQNPEYKTPNSSPFRPFW